MLVTTDRVAVLEIGMNGIPHMVHLRSVSLAGLSSLMMVFVFQPIFMSYLPRPRIRERLWRQDRTQRNDFGHRLIDRLLNVPITPGPMRGALLAAIASLVGMLFSGWAAPFVVTMAGIP